MSLLCTRAVVKHRSVGPQHSEGFNLVQRMVSQCCITHKNRKEITQGPKWSLCYAVYLSPPPLVFIVIERSRLFLLCNHSL